MAKTMNKLMKKIFIFYFSAFIVIFLLLFLPAGSLYYWQGWIYFITIFITMIFIVSYFWKYDQQLLERRMKYKETVAKQTFIQIVGGISFFIVFIVAGLDYRYHWSNVPILVVIISDLIVFLGYLFVFFVFRENSYASRIIEVEREQKVITTGSYAIVRHPMYLGVLLMYLFTPLALGSYWAIIFFLPLIPLIVIRIQEEEKYLLETLSGYKEYCQKTKYHLVPFIW